MRIVSFLIILGMIGFIISWKFVLFFILTLTLISFVRAIVQIKQDYPQQETITTITPKTTPKKITVIFKKKGSQFLASSMTKEGEWYVIDPVEVTCTCPDWIKRRANEPRHLPTRICKHLVKYYENRPKKTPQDLLPWRPLIRRCAEYNIGCPVQDVIFGLTSDGKHFMIDFYSYPQNGWVDISIGYFQYGYNANEWRWSYKRKPDEYLKFVSLIEGYLKGKIPKDTREYSLDNK